MRFGVVETSRGRRVCLLDADAAYYEPNPTQLPASIEQALAIGAPELRDRFDAADLDSLERTAIDATSLLPPVGPGTEVWAAGVTYERSLDARATEAAERSVYDRVYEAERPELFLKAVGRRVVGPGAAVGIRSDSTWNVPEPELVLLVNSRSETVGYTLGNDMSSRSIEGENPLYLPQAKIYERACAIGPAVVPAWELERPEELVLTMQILRNGNEVFAGETALASMRRSLESLVKYLFRSQSFPSGVALMTGTGIVPPDGFTLAVGDVVRIGCDRIGTLENTVALV